MFNKYSVSDPDPDPYWIQEAWKGLKRKEKHIQNEDN
jgi:hypothetical protein